MGRKEIIICFFETFVAFIAVFGFYCAAIEIKDVLQKIKRQRQRKKDKKKK